MIGLTEAVQIAAMIGAVVALATLIKGVIEFSRQNALKRADYFFALVGRMSRDPVLRVVVLLADDDPELANLPLDAKVSFLGLCEEVALSVNSGILRSDVAHYMFGFAAIRCWDSAAFWSTIDKTSYYWSLFGQFAEDMRAHQTRALSLPVVARHTKRRLRF